MGLRAGIVQINVTDLREARRFYGEVLGIPLREPFAGDGPFELDLGEGPRVLVYGVPLQVPSAYPDGTGLTLVLFTEDLEATVARWKEAGVSFVPVEWSADPSGIAACPYGRFIGFRDPFGNVHELLEPR